MGKSAARRLLELKAKLTTNIAIFSELMALPSVEFQTSPVISYDEGETYFRFRFSRILNVYTSKKEGVKRKVKSRLILAAERIRKAVAEATEIIADSGNRDVISPLEMIQAMAYVLALEEYLERQKMRWVGYEEDDDDDDNSMDIDIDDETDAPVPSVSYPSVPSFSFTPDVEMATSDLTAGSYPTTPEQEDLDTAMEEDIYEPYVPPPVPDFVWADASPFSGGSIRSASFDKLLAQTYDIDIDKQVQDAFDSLFCEK